MCGIVGYIGEGRAADIIHDSLKKLEYRGYDSYGFATLDGNGIHIRKGVGKISQVSPSGLPGSVGIGHSRWATHGKVTEDNSHPHTDCSGEIAVVHNGIIENYQELRKELESRGHSFRSETDTEIIPHLIEENISLGLEKAVMEAVRRLKGRYAIVVLRAGEKRVVGVRRGSPLIVGKGEGSSFLASDIPAFLAHTNRVMYLDDNEMVITDGVTRFLNIESGKPVHKRLIEIEWDADQAEKGEYPHFMIKEIMEQKDTIRRAIDQNEELIKETAEEIRKARGTFLTGCGTAGKVCLAGEYLFSRIANEHINFIVSSEFPNYHHFLTDSTLLITISRERPQEGSKGDIPRQRRGLLLAEELGQELPHKCGT
jgi:glucosamine--fructose-6-phosphate aminotransferase (isomerizing)